MKCDIGTLMYVEKGREAGMWDTRRSLLSRLMIWRAARKNQKTPLLFQSQRLWGTLLLRTLLNVLIGGPNELWPRSAICPPQQAYWPHADAYQNDGCGIKFKWVGRSEMGGKKSHVYRCMILLCFPLGVAQRLLIILTKCCPILATV